MSVCRVFDLFESMHILDNVSKVSAYLEQQLDTVVQKYDFLTERRGMGLMQGIATTKKAADISAKALEEGLVIITAGADVIRMLPPLIITEADVNEMIDKFTKALERV